ncbi:MAG TPA: UDP-N-acetylmuramate:L-alanyl-gamma-D-glutamyl-meso-diaminopimelate ligase, partial [Candidatus Thioglobus sp.]|nr:UDP-N-acetylmuramate:L-alanyl-gamma-D-glutamyl-meso-diaminopimelate ligase [Candidatus Thioglobus sp.]
MHIHILGIAGTFMGSLALIAEQLGHTVSGQDQGVYPPMSTQLDEQNINFTHGYNADDMPQADVFIIGNALSRGNECVEEILTKQYSYTSGAQWLSENVLQNKWVLAVSGTHGKTTTASMLACILDYAGYNPSFLIGGVVEEFGVSSRLTDSNFFVIEADEYDTAFFDKRSKFVHY